MSRKWAFNHRIRIGQTWIGPDERPFIIAEMSGNHNGSIDKALSIVDEAAACGVSALKIQTYTADTMTLDIRDKEFFIDDPKSLWKGHSLYELYGKAYTPWAWHRQIFRRCAQKGILGFSTPFDFTAVDFLERLGSPLYKIASFENTDLSLIEKVARTGKPLIVSTGMATIRELEEVVDTVKKTGNKNLVLLKCTSAYPADPGDSHLNTLKDLSRRFGCLVGVSDHTVGIGVSLAGVALGATVIEKHFIMSRSEGGVDSAFSMEPSEMKLLIEESVRAWMSRGRIRYGALPHEKASLRFRRSLYVVRDIKKGDVFDSGNVRAIRPGYGLAPKNLGKILGRPASRNVRRGTALSWKLVSAKNGEY